MVTNFKEYFIPMFLCKVAAGFPSPADDFIERRIDLNEALIEHPAATVILPMPDRSLMDYGIFAGDYLIVDRAVTPAQGDIVVCQHEGEHIFGKIDKSQAKVGSHSLCQHTVVIGVISYAIKPL